MDEMDIGEDYDYRGDLSLVADDSQVLLARFEQGVVSGIDVHAALKHNLFSPETFTNLLSLISRPEITDYPEDDMPRETFIEMAYNDVNVFSQINIRFASFHVSILTPLGRTNGLGNDYPILIRLIDTQSIEGMTIINLMKLPEEEKTAYITASNSICNVLVRKIIRELKVLNYKLNGTDDPRIKPCELIFNFDIYYNRTRDRAGVFHRDISPMSGLVNNISLEFFAEEGTVFLGPEVIIHDAGNEPLEVLSNVYEHEMIDEKLRNMSLTNNWSNKMSLRVMCQDATTILFNNMALIHATPTTNASFLTNYSERIEATQPLHPAVINTNTMARSFLRTHIVVIDPTTPIINAILFEPINAYFLSAVTSGMDYINTPLEMRDLLGGAILSENIPKVKVFIKSNNKSTKNKKISKKQSRTIRGSKASNVDFISDFKIVGKVSKPFIEVKSNSAFKKVKNKKEIKQNELKLLKTLKMLANMKLREKYRNKKVLKKISKRKSKSKSKRKSTRKSKRTSIKMIKV
jgi:hypothetical protein